MVVCDLDRHQLKLPEKLGELVEQLHLRLDDLCLTSETGLELLLLAKSACVDLALLAELALVRFPEQVRNAKPGHGGRDQDRRDAFEKALADRHGMGRRVLEDTN